MGGGNDDFTAEVGVLWNIVFLKSFCDVLSPCFVLVPHGSDGTQLELLRGPLLAKKNPGILSPFCDDDESIEEMMMIYFLPLFEQTRLAIPPSHVRHHF